MSDEKGTPSPAADSKRSKRDDPDRDKGGLFLPGHGIKSPGNPNVMRLHELRQLVRKAVTDEDVDEILKKLTQQAKAGDTIAAKEVLNRRLGKATEHVVVDNGDSGHVDALREQLARYSGNPLIRALRRADGYREGQVSPHDMRQAERLCEFVETIIGMRTQDGTPGDRFDQALDRLESAAVESRTVVRVLPGPLG